MAARVTTLAFDGVEARKVTCEVQLTDGQMMFAVVGLGDKAVGEARERVRGAFAGLGLSLPPKRIVANLAPADLPKEGSHYDLPLALGVLIAMGIVPQDFIDSYVAVGELSLDGSLAPVSGALPAAMAAHGWGLGLICPQSNGPEAAWVGDCPILAPASLVSLINHAKGTRPLIPPKPGLARTDGQGLDLKEVRGQETAKRGLELAAAGGHNLLFMGPPGSGKSMLAQRLPGLLPPLTPIELLETSMIWSMAGLIARGELTHNRPFRAPHHSASMAALTGGGLRAKPGEVSLAHNGVLFLDELPEFSAQALDSLRQPLEADEVIVARANHHVRYPARVQLVAAMNPCRCGHGGLGKGACGKAPRCQRDYQNRLSGPLLDRIDLKIEVQAVSALDLAQPPAKEGTKEAAARVFHARQRQLDRQGSLNARLGGGALEDHAHLSAPAKALLQQAAEGLGLSARAWTRSIRLARTIADLEGSITIERHHMAESLVYRQTPALA